MTLDFSKARAVDPTQEAEILTISNSRATTTTDAVATEEPLEIRLGFTFLSRPSERALSVTMRTPGDDAALAAGFLFCEEIISSSADIDRIELSEASPNQVRVVLLPHVNVDIASVQRNFYTTSSCGVCGKASLDALSINHRPPLSIQPRQLPHDLIHSLPGRLRNSQALFADTGGAHAAGLFDPEGQLLSIAEDVGRHNAMDKLIGRRLLDDSLIHDGSLVVFSGRASFELLQKALVAKISTVVAVGAPSSLAVDLARQFGITLIGFTREDRFNIYAHPERILLRS